MDRNDSFPRLYGAAGTFQPPRAVEDSERPPHPDDEPLHYERERADTEGEVLAPRPYRYGARPAPTSTEDDEGQLRPTGVGLRGLAHTLIVERSQRPVPEFRKPADPGVASERAGE